MALTTSSGLTAPGRLFKVWVHKVDGGGTVVVLNTDALYADRVPAGRLGEVAEALRQGGSPTGLLSPTALNVPLNALIEATVDLRAHALTITYLSAAHRRRVPLTFASRADADEAFVSLATVMEDSVEVFSLTRTPREMALLPGGVTIGLIAATILMTLGTAFYQNSILSGHSPMPRATDLLSTLDPRYLIYEAGPLGVAALGGTLIAFSILWLAIRMRHPPLRLRLKRRSL
jgi:hypothetical protein